MTGAHKSTRPSKRMRTTGGDSDSEDEAGRAPRGEEEEDMEAPRGEVEEGVERFQIHAGGTVFCVAGTVIRCVCVCCRLHFKGAMYRAAVSQA
jgi:hypothetical protein